MLFALASSRLGYSSLSINLIIFTLIAILLGLPTFFLLDQVKTNQLIKTLNILCDVCLGSYRITLMIKVSVIFKHECVSFLIDSLAL